MNDFFAFLRDLTHNRNFHLFAVGVHLAGLLFFAYCYSLVQSNLFLIFAGWSAWFGACSLTALRGGKPK